MTGRIAALAISTILLLTAAAPAQTGSPDSEILQMLKIRVDGQKWATGIVVGVVDRKGRRTIAYGTTTKGGSTKVDGDTVFEIGSITKVFTALILSDMARRGEVRLDDPVAKYLPPSVSLPRDGERQITLADLATHTSGLPLRPANLISKDPDNKYAGYSEELLFQFLSSYKPPSAIGSRYEYSNVGCGLLGVALSRRAGTRYDDLLRNRVTGPLSLNDTRMDLTDDMKRRAATGYDNTLLPAPHWDMGVIASAGSLRSTANDLSKLLEAVLGYSNSPLALALQAMTQTRRPGGMQPSTQIALAWNILDDKDREVVWKNGSVGGFRAFIGYDAKVGTGVVALANAQTAQGADDIGMHILDPGQRFNSAVPHVHTQIAVDGATLDRYVGRYKYSDTDILTIVSDGDRLFMQEPNQDRLELFAEGERDFFLKIMDAQITFVMGPDGKAATAIWHEAGEDQRGVRIP